MKKTNGFIAMIIFAAVLGFSMVGCEPTDGTLEIVNETGSSIIASWVLFDEADDPTAALKESKTIAIGGKNSWAVPGDTKIIWSWSVVGANPPKTDAATATIAAGGILTITAK